MKTFKINGVWFVVAIACLGLILGACSNPSSGGDAGGITDITDPVGVYKGVVAGVEGSSGIYTVKVSDEEVGTRAIVNGGLYRAIIDMTIDGSSFRKEGTATATVSGAIISFAIDFVLNILGYSFDFEMSVDSSGNVTSVTLASSDADAEELAITGVQEEASETVELWQGVISGDADGVWNFSKKGVELEGAWSVMGDPDDPTNPGNSGSFAITLTGGGFTNMDVGSGVIASGTIGELTASGTWSIPGDGGSGGWSGSRTL